MSSSFTIGDRVRVRFGVDRGKYGVITHIGGDDGTYYGVRLDVHLNDVGYSEYELAKEKKIPRPLWGENGTRGVYVNPSIAVCPECGGELAARSTAHETESGRPVAESIELDCMNELRDGKTCHQWRQSDWQPVRNRIYQWVDARVDYPNR